MDNKLHKINFITNIGGLSAIVGGLIWIVSHWGGIADNMHRMKILYEITPHLDSLVQKAPSMNRLIKDYEIIHGLIANEQLQEADFDSLKKLIIILSYGKAPYQDSVWMMDRFGIWHEIKIEEHPLLK